MIKTVAAKLLDKKTLRQLLTFGVVGMLNTASDFAIFNVLYGLVHVPLLLANMMTVTLVMSMSLYLNRRFVFGATHKSYASYIAKFLLVTLVGLYVLQNVILVTVLGILEGMQQLTGIFANHLVQVNIAKAIGVIGSAIWNFTLYRAWVFRKTPAPTEAPRPESETE